GHAMLAPNRERTAITFSAASRSTPVTPWVKEIAFPGRFRDSPCTPGSHLGPRLDSPLCGAGGQLTRIFILSGAPQAQGRLCVKATPLHGTRAPTNLLRTI